MRFIFIAVLLLAVVLAIAYIAFKGRIDGHVKYYNLGLSCFDKKTREYDRVLDQSIVGSPEVKVWEVEAYLRGREVAWKRYEASQKRYKKFILDK